MCTPDVPFTPSNVMRKVKEVRRWWGNGSLTSHLCIPKSKQEEIRRNFPDEMEQKKQSISYLINTDPLAGWRRLITALDRMRKSQLADSIRPNAEPLTGTIHIYCPSIQLKMLAKKTSKFHQSHLFSLECSALITTIA